jgi:hypothetical protein
MKNRGPIDFLAVLVVEFGGLALLLAALPLLVGGGNHPRDVGSPVGQPAESPRLPWPRANPTPWDHEAADRPLAEEHPAYVESRLRERGQTLVQSLLAQVERVLEDR